MLDRSYNRLYSVREQFKRNVSQSKQVIPDYFLIKIIQLRDWQW